MFKEKELLTEEESIEILKQIVKFTLKLSRSYHGNLKATNVFLDEDSLITGVGDVWIHHLDENQGFSLDDVRLIAPEYLTDCEKRDVRTDIWAMGVLFYRCLTGKYPF